MGTNYYLKSKPCITCNHHSHVYHIAKSSSGHPVLFQSHKMENYWPSISSFEDIRHYVIMRSFSIYDEYEKEISLYDFEKMAQSAKEKHPHAKIEMHPHEIDREGYIFTSEDFS